MPKNFRIFIALALPKPIISGITSVRDGLRAHRLKIRWVASGNIHLTLAFLGVVPMGDMRKVFQAVKKTAETQSPFPLSVSGVGVFPTPIRPRVIWLGITGATDRLAALKETLDAHLHGAIHGYKKERRRYHAHITLGRTKEEIDPSRIGSALKEFYNYRSDSFTVKQIDVFSSRLTHRGAIYSKLKRTPLQDISS